MARGTYKTRALCVRKTPLNEADVIVTLVCCDGSQVSAVAKGARKPSNTFASRLELYSLVDLLCVFGKNLDIVKEARLVAGHKNAREVLELSAAGAVMAQILCSGAQKNLENRPLYNMSVRAFDELDAANIKTAPAISAAHVLKTFAFCGVRPTLSECCLCGTNLQGALSVLASKDGFIKFSANEGGILCNNCNGYDTKNLPATTISNANALLMAQFANIESMKIAKNHVASVLKLCQAWARVHFNCKLSAVDFLLKCAM